MQFGSVIITQYPYPIAWACYDFNNAFERVERFMKLVTLFERLLRFLAFVAVAAYIRDKRLFSEIDVHEMKAEFKKLEIPTLGHLYSVLTRVLKLYKRNEQSFPIPEMAEVLQKNPPASSVKEAYRFIRSYLGLPPSKCRSLLQFFELMINYRNNTWGHGVGQIGPEFAELHSESLFLALNEILSTSSFLSYYPLNYIHRIDVHKGALRYYIVNFNGLNPSKFPVLEVPLGRANYYEENRVYLFGRQGKPLLSLHPFFIVHKGDLYSFSVQQQDEKPQFRHCRRETLYRPEQVESYILPAIASGDTDTLQAVEIGVFKEEEQTLPSQMEQIIEMLSQESRAILEVAAGEAIRMGEHSVNEAHLLIAMTRYEESPVTPLLKKLGMEAQQMRAALRGILGFQRDVPRWSIELLRNAGAAAFRCGDVRLSPRLEEALKKACSYDQAKAAESVKPLHLFKAALEVPHSIAARFFKMRGYSVDEILSITKAEEPTQIIELIPKSSLTDSDETELLKRLSQIEEELKWIKRKLAKMSGSEASG